MTLRLTSCKQVREPGFSRSECLELARLVETRDLVMHDGLGTDCSDPFCDRIVLDGRYDISVRERDIIVCALREYAK